MDEGGLVTCTLPLEHVGGCDNCKRVAHTMANEDLIHEHLPFDFSQRSEVELIDHLFGFKAGAAGEPNDETKSPAWQRGWADGQK
jgi:hypothetical protein